jgi:hypothetical protein
LSDSLKEGVILRGVPAPDGVCLMVDVLGRMIRVQHEPFHIARAEMEHACFMVIDPNDRMKVMATHGMSPFAIVASCISTIFRVHCHSGQRKQRINAIPYSILSS